MPPLPGPETLAILRRRKRVAALYLCGHSQYAIAERLAVAQSTVSRDLKWLHGEWRKAALGDTDALKAAELARIDQLERTYWRAWRDSRQDREVQASQKTTKKGGRAADGGEGERAAPAPPPEETLRAGVRKEGRDGNAAFLAGVQWCINKRAEILGLNAPQKVAPTSPDGNEPYAGDPDALVAILVRAAGALPAGGDGPGAEPGAAAAAGGPGPPAVGGPAGAADPGV